MRTLDKILEQAFTDGQSDTMWQNERHIEIFATAKAEIEALITEARIDELIKFVETLGEQDPYEPLGGTPRQYVEGKLNDRLAELKEKK